MDQEMQNATVARMFIEQTKASVAQEHRRILHSFSQLSEEDVWRRRAPSVNSIGTIVLHLCGNLRQWFLHGVGGQEDVRYRPGEFAEPEHISKAELLARFENIVREVQTILDGVTADDLLAERCIQGMATRILAAIYSTVNHLEGHSLQIAYVTHCYRGEDYMSFWTPENEAQGA